MSLVNPTIEETLIAKLALVMGGHLAVEDPKAPMLIAYSSPKSTAIVRLTKEENATLQRIMQGIPMDVEWEDENAD